MRTARVTAVVVTYNAADVLAGCLDSIAQHAPQCETIVVDNASGDASVQIARGRPRVRVIASADNEGFSKANNRALREIDTEFALVLNPDARLTATTLPELLAAADRSPRAAALGPLTEYADGAPQVSFGPDLSLASERRQRWLVTGVKAGEPAAIARWRALAAAESAVDWVSGSCMLLRMEAARAVGFFDERYFLYEEDADLCLRLRQAGHEVRFVPTARVIHALGTSMAKSSARAREAYDASHRLYYRLHRHVLERAVLEAVILGKRLLRR